MLVDSESLWVVKRRMKKEPYIYCIRYDRNQRSHWTSNREECDIAKLYEHLCVLVDIAFVLVHV
jgi:hypothetical protein